MKLKIETPRLYLRAITLNDVQDFFEMDSNPNVHKYLGNNPVKHLAQSKAWIEDILEQYQRFGMGRLAMVTKDTNTFVGWSGIKYEQELRKAFNYYDLGYRLKEQFWGNGYATEAAIASLKYGFIHLNLSKICAAADVEHTASNTILKKVGLEFSETFTYEGSLCNWYILTKANWLKIEQR